MLSFLALLTGLVLFVCFWLLRKSKLLCLKKMSSYFVHVVCLKQETTE